MDVAAWLRELGLGQYEQAFNDNAVDGEVLPRLTADDLRDLGVVAIGHRRKLLDAIAALRAHAPKVAATPELEGERRQVTIVFADLAGYTALSRELDAEEVHALLERFFTAPTASSPSMAAGLTSTSATVSWRSSARQSPTAMTQSGRCGQRWPSATRCPNLARGGGASGWRAHRRRRRRGGR